MKMTKGPYTLHKQSDMIAPNNPPTFWNYEGAKGSGSIRESKANGRTTKFSAIANGKASPTFTNKADAEKWLSSKLD
jgi:hypothetical protein